MSKFVSAAAPSATAAPPLSVDVTYFDEKKNLKKGDESVASRAPQPAPHRSLLAMRMSRRTGNEVESFRLPTFYSFTTTAATVFNTVIPMTPSDSTEYSAIAALYDEIIVDSISVKWVVGQESTFSGTQLPALWVWAYDPISSAVLSSKAGGVQHSQHFLAGISPNNSGQFPIPESKHGLFNWDIIVPVKSARQIASTAVFGHDWSSTSEAAIYGYIKPYLSALGSAGTFGGEYMVTYMVRVRCRT
jgi:hypothetical protein